MTALVPSSFSSDSLGVYASTSAVLYQRNATNTLAAQATSTATNIGNLITNSTQLDVTGEVAYPNTTQTYQFNLQGNSIKANLQNITNSSDLRYQLKDGSGNIVADSAGNAAQQIAYVDLTTSAGLKTNAGQYTLTVSYAPTAVQNPPQTYAISLYSGNSFDSAYETTAATQTKASQHVAIDNTDTYATSDAQLFSKSAYHTVDEKATTGPNIGWLYQNKTALSVESQVTSTDATDYYNFTFEKGSALKLAFDNSTNTSGLRVQLLDASGTDVIADSAGNTKQQAAYAALTSSTGLNAQTGQYVVKVTYGQTADRTKPQTYDFSLYSGSSYKTLDTTTASAETYGHAVAAGDLGSTSYSSRTAAATYLFNQAQGTTTDVLSVLQSLA